MKNIKCVVMMTAFCASGCYSYVRADPDQVPLRSNVQAVLSTEGEIDLRSRVGITDGRLQGELVDRSQDQLMIAVATTGPFTGATGERLVQRVDVPRRHVLLVEVREASTPKTVGLLVGAAGAATAVAVVTLGRDRNPGEVDVQPPPPDERVGVLPRSPLGIP